MALYYASGSTRYDTGKFRRRPRLGVQYAGSKRCGLYRYELLSMRSTGPIERERFHVSIYNARNLRVAYLRDFPSTAAATSATEAWVAERSETHRNGL